VNIRAMRLFRLVVTQGSLAAAAAAMSLSPPAASRLIALLEASCACSCSIGRAGA